MSVYEREPSGSLKDGQVEKEFAQRFATDDHFNLVNSPQLNKPTQK